MKYILLLSLLIACTPKVVPLKNSYDTKPFQLKTSSGFEVVWGNIVELFTKNGIGIKIIDKSSGLIVAQNTNAPITSEDKNGKLINPKAWAVTSKLYDPGSGRYYYPKEGTIEWNIYVKRNDDNTTTINVNLISVTDISGMVMSGTYIMTTQHTLKSRALTTGVFEKYIADQIK